MTTQNSESTKDQRPSENIEDVATVDQSSEPLLPAKTGLLRSGLLVSCMTMLSRILGVFRDIVLAMVLGGVASGGQAGAFYIAFKVPQFLRQLFAEGAFAQAFVPVLSEYQTTKSPQQVRELIDRVCGVLTVVLLVVVLLVILGSHYITFLVAPGFADDPEKFGLTESLLQITFPYLLLISLAGFFGSILNANNRFAVPAFTPIWMNVCMIAAGLYLTKVIDNVAMALAYGVLIAGFIQLFFLFPFVYKIGLFPRPKFDLSHPGVRKILKLMLPALLGVSVAQINLVFDTILASFLPDGSIAWLYFSQRLSDLPLGVFAIAISTVILPGLSRQFSSNNVASFAPTLDWGIRFVLMIAIPSVVAISILAQPILATLFLYGKTTLLDITMSSYSLTAYSLGIVFFMLTKVLVPGYYARQDMKTPVKIAVYAMLSNIVLNIAFVVPLHFYFNIGHAGLALATSVSAMLNVYLLWRGLAKQGIYRMQPGFWMHLARFILAGLIMGIVLYLLVGETQVWLDYTSWQRLLHLLAICALGGLSYFAVLFAAGMRIKDFRLSI